MDPPSRRILTEIERRKVAKEDTCYSCDGSGKSTSSSGYICSDCLGQGILLTAEEYRTVLAVAGFDLAELDGDQILDDAYLD